ncbi:MAG TPA: hypothetical protein VFW80_05030 [Gaiellaceae bacterium]|nr:hypothetical protein [Gaiellaceae bacterium]
MPRRFAARRGGSAVPYRILVRGGITRPLVGPLEGMTVESTGDRSLLRGDVVDQAQLHGILRWLTDVGVEIISVNPADEPRAD